MTLAKPRSFCDRSCTARYNSLAYSGEGNPAYGKTYRSKATHPEWADKISKTSVERGVNIGEKNGMKRSDVAEKMSKTRRERVTSDPAYREARSKSMREAWARGDYAGVAVGRCKWYDHTRPDGSVVKLQGTWEVAFARWLDASNLSYDAHKGRWTYTDMSGVERSYYPDFYVHPWNTAVDVKGAFWDGEQASKLDFVRASNPTKQLLIANKSWFIDHDVDYVSVQHELLRHAVSKR